MEFKDGKHTGRTIDADIIYMLEDYTGLEEGYCILGIDAKVFSGEVSETDTQQDETGGEIPGQMSIEDYQKGGQEDNEQTAEEKEE